MWAMRTRVFPAIADNWIESCKLGCRTEQGPFNRSPNDMRKVNTKIYIVRTRVLSAISPVSLRVLPIRIDFFGIFDKYEIRISALKIQLKSLSIYFYVTTFFENFDFE